MEHRYETANCRYIDRKPFFGHRPDLCADRSQSRQDRAEGRAQSAVERMHAEDGGAEQGLTKVRGRTPRQRQGEANQCVRRKEANRCLRRKQGYRERNRLRGRGQENESARTRDAGVPPATLWRQGAWWRRSQSAQSQELKQAGDLTCPAQPQGVSLKHAGHEHCHWAAALRPWTACQRQPSRYLCWPWQG